MKDLTQNPNSKLDFLVEDLSALPDPNDITKWFVEGLIVEGGLNYLTAQPGHGKSLVSLDLAHACTHNRKFLGLFDVRQTNVLYLDQDSNNKRELNKRVLTFGFEIGAGLRRMNQQGFRFDDRGHIEWLLAYCEGNGVHLVIFDAMVRFHRLNEGNPQEMAIVRDHLQMLTSAGITLLVIHHNSRAGAYRGSGEIGAMADAMCSLKKSKSGRQFTLTVTKERTLSELTWNAIRIDPDENDEGCTILQGVKFLDESGDDEDSGTQEDVLIACSEKALTKTQIRTFVRGDAVKVDAAIAALVNSGQLVMTQEGKSKMYLVADLADNQADSLVVDGE